MDAPEAEEASASSGGPGAADLLACVLAALVAALVTVVLPEGSPIRLVLTLPMVLFVPGYALIEAVARPGVPHGRRAERAFLAAGVTVGFVGVLALSTAIVAGGFRAGSIVMVVTLASLLLAGVAWFRRTRVATTPSP